MVSMDGEYYYTETQGEGVVCGTYFLAEHDEIVEVEVLEFDATCGPSQVEVSLSVWSLILSRLVLSSLDLSVSVVA